MYTYRSRVAVFIQSIRGGREKKNSNHADAESLLSYFCSEHEPHE